MDRPSTPRAGRGLGGGARPLTEGSEAVAIVTFALPMLAGNVFQQLYYTVDSVIVGHVVGKQALAAVGASFPILFFMTSLVLGITMGASVMAAQFYGARDLVRLKRTVDTSAVFIVGASVAVTGLGWLLSGPMLDAIKVPAEVGSQAAVYLRIVFLGTVFTFGYNAASAILRALGDSATPFSFLVVATLTNVALDLLFVMGLHWGIRGAAWATVISQAVAFGMAVHHIQGTREPALGVRPRALMWDLRTLRTMLRIGLPSGVQHSLVSLGFVALNGIVASFGTDVLAGYAAASRLDSFASMPAMNLSIALSMFVGQNLGAGKPHRVARGYTSCLLIAGSIALATTAVLVFWRRALMGLFTSDGAVIAQGERYLVIVSSFYVLFSSMFVTGGVLRGAGDTMAHMLFTFTGQWLVRIPMAALLSSRWGPKGIWWAIPLGWAVGLGLSLSYYASGRWRRKVVVQTQAAPVQAAASP